MTTAARLASIVGGSVMSIRPLFAAMAACLVSSPGSAQDGAEEAFRLGVVEVIGVAPVQPAPGTERVDAEAIERHDRRNVAEALDLLPGVTLQNVGQRRERMVWIRGFNSRQIPIYIDGVPVYVPYDGNIDLARFGVDTLSEILVTKGLTSVLYGPNALGGSVNLVSRRPTRPFEASAGAGFDLDRSGDLAGYRAEARVATRQENGYAQVTASYADNDFFRLPSGFRPTTAENGGRRENSADRDRLVTAKFAYTPNATDEYSISYHRQDGEKQDPPYSGRANVTPRYWRWPDWDKESLYLISRTALGGDTDLRLRAYYDSFYNQLDSWDDANYSTQRRPYAFTSVYDDFTTGASSELEQRWSERQVTRLALHFKRDVHREVSAIGAPQQHFIDKTWSAGVEHVWRPGERWTITPGAAYSRLEGVQADNLVSGMLEPFAVETNGAYNLQIAIGYALDEDTRFFGGISRKTRFPTLKDRYSYRMGSALPNPDLEAERSTNLEVGYEGALGAFRYRAALFHSRLQDAIESVSLDSSACTSPPCSQLRNIGEQRNQGVELSAEVDLGERLRLAGSYTFLDRDNRSQPQIRPLDTPREKLFASLDYALGERWSALASATSESRRYSSTDGGRIAPGFTIYDARLKWQAADDVAVAFGIHNISDKRYMYEDGYPEPGRTYAFTFNYRY